MAYTSEERRASPRIEINGEMTYYTEDSAELHQGMVEDMSLLGARIWIGKQLPTPSQLYFRVESRADEDSEEFIATLIHCLPLQKQSLYGYGCIIEKTASLAE